MGTEPSLRRLRGRPKAIEAHLIGRGVLLELLSEDAAVRAIFGAFDVTDLAGQLGRLSEGIAHRAGLAGRAHLFEPGVTIPVTSEYETLNAAYQRRVRETFPMLRQRLETLVYGTYHLEWPWLVFELGDLYTRLLNSSITGDGWHGTFVVPPRTLATPPAPEQGESREVYLQRRRVFDTPTRDRTGVRADAETITRDVRIFYRLRLKHDNVRAVAKDEGMSPWQTKKAAERAFKVLSEPIPGRTSRPPTP